MRTVIILTVALMLAGCTATGQMTIMPRDSGNVYTGIVHADGLGGGTITMTSEGRTYTGPFARTGTNDSFGYFQTYGHGRTSTGVTQASGGHNAGKAILSSPDNHEMRCEIEGDGMGHGGAICLDDQRLIYDAVVLF